MSTLSSRLPHFNNTQLIQKIQKILDHVRAGGMVIMVDDESRENEGDLVVAAQDVTSEAINFMAKEARGLICLPMEASMIERLQLPMMNDHSKSLESRKTAFTVSIEAKKGVSTGISAKDRATTIKLAIDESCRPEDLVVPGHVFPLKARPGGVLTRAGHTEGSIDLVKLAGKKPASVICEIMNDDGTMARLDDLKQFSLKHKIPMISIEELIMYRMLYDSMVSIEKKEKIITSYGTFDAVWLKSDVDSSYHVALTKGGDFSRHVTHVRVYRQKFLEDTFGVCDLEDQGKSMHRVEYGLKMLRECEHGVYVYLASDHHQIGHQSSSLPQDYMDARLYGIGAQILCKLGVKKLILNTITPRQLVAISGFGLEVIGVKVWGDEKPQPLEASDISSVVVTPASKRSTVPSLAGKRLLMVKALWHPEIVDSLVEGATKTLLAGGIESHQVVLREVPGSYELLLAAQKACLEKKWDIIFCFGCLIAGKTFHYQWVIQSLIQGFVQLQLAHQIPIIQGVICADNKDLAMQRVSNSKKHRGKEAAAAALKLFSQGL